MRSWGEGGGASTEEMPPEPGKTGSDTSASPLLCLQSPVTPFAEPPGGRGAWELVCKNQSLGVQSRAENGLKSKRQI